MGTAYGPLLDLLFASESLALVGTAGSSFSEVLAALLAVDLETAKDERANDRKILIRTPFVKSSQVHRARHRAKRRPEATIRAVVVRVAVDSVVFWVFCLGTWFEER